MIEFADHLHEHMEAPVKIKNGNYVVPTVSLLAQLLCCTSKVNTSWIWIYKYTYYYVFFHGGHVNKSDFEDFKFIKLIYFL